MAAGFASLALAFVIVCGAAVEAQSGAVSPLWIIVAIPLLTLAELLTGPIALAAVSRLAPAPVANVAMGGFSAAVGIGALLSGQIGALAIGDQMLPVSIAIAAAAATISVFLIVQRANLQRLGV
jgi:dipeptide/tripeptide permease